MTEISTRLKKKVASPYLWSYTNLTRSQRCDAGLPCSTCEKAGKQSDCVYKKTSRCSSANPSSNKPATTIGDLSKPESPPSSALSSVSPDDMNMILQVSVSDCLVYQLTCAFQPASFPRTHATVWFLLPTFKTSRDPSGRPGRPHRSPILYPFCAHDGLLHLPRAKEQLFASSCTSDTPQSLFEVTLSHERG
jgi:hypothetical protein